MGRGEAGLGEAPHTPLPPPCVTDTGPAGRAEAVDVTALTLPHGEGEGVWRRQRRSPTSRLYVTTRRKMVITLVLYLIKSHYGEDKTAQTVSEFLNFIVFFFLCFEYNTCAVFED